MTLIHTACTYDCPDACGLVAESDDGKFRLRGDRNHPITKGHLCKRVRRHFDRLRHSERVTVPRARSGDRWRELSWDEAYDLAASELGSSLRQSGPESVVFIDGGGSLGLSKAMPKHFFCSLGPVTTLSGGACGEAGDAAQQEDFGDAACHDYTDLENSNAIVLWGKNPVATGVHLVPFLLAARKRGAPLVLIEVRPTETTKLADRVISVAPSGDGFLALAILRLLCDRGRLDREHGARAENFDEFLSWLSADERSLEVLMSHAGVSLADVELLADLYRDRSPVATMVGWGLQRRLSGGTNLRCIDALGLLTGQVGRPGGGVNFTSTRRRGLDLSWMAPATGRRVPTSNLASGLAELREPSARFVYVSGANPVTQLPDSHGIDRALRSAGFTVVVDAFFTDTAEAADLFLPVALMLEEDDVVGSYQHHHVAVTRRVLPPPRGVPTDLEIVNELSRRLGRPDDPVLLDPAKTLETMTARWFQGDIPGVRRNPEQAQIPFVSSFPTKSGRALLVTSEPSTVPEVAGYPLVLLTPSCRSWQTSQRFEQDQQGPPQCFVHPSALSSDDCEDGDLANLESPLSTLVVRVRFDSRLTPDHCFIRRGGWVKHQRGVNALIEPHATDLGGGTAFYDQRVRLAPYQPPVDTQR